MRKRDKVGGRISVGYDDEGGDSIDEGKGRRVWLMRR